MFWNWFWSDGTTKLNLNKLNEFYTIFLYVNTALRKSYGNHISQYHFGTANINIWGERTTQVSQNAIRSFWCFTDCILRGKCSDSSETWAHAPQASANILFWNLSWIAWASPHAELQVFWLWQICKEGFVSFESSRSLTLKGLLSLSDVVWMIPFKIFKDFLLPAYFSLTCIPWSEKTWISFCFKSWEVEA